MTNQQRLIIFQFIIYTNIVCLFKTQSKHPQPLVPEAGLEPARSCLPRILSPVRLPLRHSGKFESKNKICFGGTTRI